MKGELDMHHILFKCKYFTIRVREVAIIILLLILLFFGLRACQNNENGKKKEDKISNICEFSKENINDFDRLMSRADLCSEGWIKDLGAYIDRLEDQEKYIKKKKDDTSYQKLLTYQKALVKDLKALEKNQDDKTIKDLEKSFKKYKTFYEDLCRKGKVGK